MVEKVTNKEQKMIVNKKNFSNNLWTYAQKLFTFTQAAMPFQPKALSNHCKY